jgi:hypothetical protein
MSERNKHPEIDIQTPARALIGLEPVQDLPEPKPDRALDIPSLIRLFQIDAYPLPESTPLQIAVGKETSLTLYPQDEALEYRQQTPEHTVYLRASKRGELAFSFVAFGRTAESLRDSLTKGQMVTVGGYPHQREISGKAGQTRTVTEVYLAGLKHHN